MAAVEKLVLYTNHKCPWAHRAHIALNELKIPYEEVIIDLSRPRDPEYLEINPRGLVPTINYNGEIIGESGIIAQFFADAHPSHLVPATSEPGGALRRARINFFVDTYSNKVAAHLHKILYSAKTAEEAEESEKAAVAGAVKELEPLLADAAPFFGGSDKLTLAEVLVGSFVQRLIIVIKAGDVLSAGLGASFQEQSPNFWKWANTVATHPSVAGLLDEKWYVEFSKEKIQAARA